jgi:hypothetical protein
MKHFLSIVVCIFASASAFAQAPKEITANEVIDRIKKNLGVEWKNETVDTFKSLASPPR